MHDCVKWQTPTIKYIAQIEMNEQKQEKVCARAIAHQYRWTEVAAEWQSDSKMW